MNPSDLLGDQPIQEMAPSVRGIREAPGAYSVVAARHARVECIFGNIDTQYTVITVLSFHLVYPARAPLRTTLYAGSTPHASQDTVQSEQRSVENGAAGVRGARRGAA